MFREKLDAQLGNFFYQISGIGDDISVEERLAMQDSITEVWEYFTGSAGKDCTNNDVLIKLSFQTKVGNQILKITLSLLKNFISVINRCLRQLLL